MVLNGTDDLDLDLDLDPDRQLDRRSDSLARSVLRPPSAASSRSVSSMRRAFARAPSAAHYCVVGLGACYKAALRAHGSAVTGVATLDVSIDETGAVRSAIVTGAGFLPGLTRCLQGAAGTMKVPSSHVESAGATAEVTLSFKAP
jgi:hypothetical protein